MKKGIHFLILAALLQTFSISAFSQAKVIGGMKAVVNGQPVTTMELDTAVQTQISYWLMEKKGRVTESEAKAEIKNIQERALNDLIDRKLILSEFKRLGGEIKDQYVDEAVDKFIRSRYGGDKDKFGSELAKTGMTLRQFRNVQKDQIAVQALRGQNNGGATLINLPDERQKVYNEIKGKYATGEKITVRMLSVDKETLQSDAANQRKLIDNIRAQILNGGSFATLAKTHSVDSFSTLGGVVGTFGRGGQKLNPRLEEFAFTLTKGRTSTVLDDGLAWRIMRVDQKSGGTPPPYEKIKDEVEKELTKRKRDANVERWLATLRRDANIRIIDGS